MRLHFYMLHIYCSLNMHAPTVLIFIKIVFIVLTAEIFTFICSINQNSCEQGCEAKWSPHDPNQKSIMTIKGNAGYYSMTANIVLGPQIDEELLS